jgi:hypothetical protein
MVVISVATKKSINYLNNLNPVKLGLIQGSFFYLCFFINPPFISDAPEKPLCKVYSGTLIVSSFIIYDWEKQKGTPEENTNIEIIAIEKTIIPPSHV